RDLRFVYANPAILKFLNLPASRVLGRRNGELVQHTTELDEQDAADRKVLDTGEPQTIERTFILPNGSVRVLRSRLFALRDADGAISGLAGLSTDVTEAHEFRRALAESEAKYRTIANAMPALVWSADVHGSRDFYNDRWYQFTGAAQGASDGWAWLDMVHADDRKRVEAHARRGISVGEPYEIEYRLKGGKEGARWFLERA